MRPLCLLLLALLLLLLPAGALEPSQVVVVYNGDSVLSTQSARRYALLRRIPPDQLVSLSGLKAGDISREEFEQKICLPLLQTGRERGWRWPAGFQGHRRILAMVLMPDLPLRIRAVPRAKDAPKLGKMQGDHAAVDSELMLLGGNYPTSGPLNNPCYGRQIALGSDKPPVMAVCRIDAPDAAAISRMIEEPVEVERQGLWGWVVVDQGGPFKEGDAWLNEVATLGRLRGQPVFHDTSRATLAEAFPLMTDTAVYFGWYTNPANGPFRPGAPGGFRFAPGAVAVHLHSFSCTSVKAAGQWAGALLLRGAAVTAGNVYEPYLGPSLHFDVFYNRLLKGSTVAEAALMATPVLSWQSIILGDPLYRPFAAMARSQAHNPFVTWWLMRRDCGDDLPRLRRTVRAREASPEGAQLAEMFAWHADSLGQPAEAAEFFATACGRYGELRDRTRTAILAATALATDKQKERAQQVLKPWLEAGAASPYLPALQKSYEAVGGAKPAAPTKPGEKKAP